jgi:feruloyl esterase
VDYLSALERWVESGTAPEKLLAYHVKDSIRFSPSAQDVPSPEAIEFTRPLYPYPLGAKYLGRGDPKSADSFEAAVRKP